ncbi:SHOCT domain-containing protein [Janibacter melonis]|uniref:SHOCT domain-containing protein n=1 Tax=Janibacter TaxID=53457 RepID=UPI000B2074AA
MMWNQGCDMMWLGMTAGVLAFWVIVVLAVRALFPGQKRAGSESPRPDALTLLDEGLARGDLSVDEYEKRRHLIIHGR